MERTEQSRKLNAPEDESASPFTIKLLEGPGHLPIHSQIKNALSYAIGGGLLRPGRQLPSVRELAAELKLAANTVARAYQELQEEGLLMSQPGRGTFVSDHLLAEEQPVGQNDSTLRSILQPALASARATGFSNEAIRGMVDELLAASTLSVGLVGLSRVLVDKWQAVLLKEFADLHIDVVCLTLDDIQEHLVDSLQALKAATYVFTLITTYADTRDALRAYNKKVSALITELSMGTHQQLAELPSNETIGLVCIDQYENSMLGIISPYVNLDYVRRVAPDDHTSLQKLFAEASVVIHTSASTPAVLSQAHPSVRLIELEFVPNRECFNQIRTVLEHARGIKGADE